MGMWGSALRRSNTGELRREELCRFFFSCDIIDFEIEYNPEDFVEGKRIFNEELDILKKCLSPDYKLGAFSSLAQILKELNVSVVIDKQIKKKSVTLEGIEKHWQEIKDSYSKDSPEAKKAQNKLDQINKEKETINIGWYLLGEYVSKEKKIYLYPNAMWEVIEKSNSGSKSIRQEFLQYLISTLIHEVMHVYFDRHGHDSFPYVHFVEEPLAEFGMLVYLDATNEFCRDWAHQNVAGKQHCYRHGATLFEQYKSWNFGLRRYLEQFKYDIDKFDMLDIYIDGNGKEIIGLPCPIKTP